jgi:TolB-like protein/Tfp pilus assembly protein PilF
VKTTDRQTCPVCNTPFEGSSEVCPVCALKGALQPENYATATELRFEHYQILKNEDQSLMELGHGSMGVTYKALDVQLQRPVALKIINTKFIGDASARQRFVREARAAGSVRHPNVATVYHLGEIGGDYFYAMEFVEGETLENVIHQAGRINTDLALEITAQVAAGLKAIHEQHLVHRDIKPSNIMVDLRDGELKSAKIIDLGLAKGVAEEGSISAAGAFAGTPGYASPEQFAGVGVDIRSDLYSLGIVLWEMLTGSLPFHGTNSELLSRHLHAPLPADQLARVPKQVVPLLEVLLEKDPALRFQTPSGLLKALAIVNDAIYSGRWLTKNELRSKAAAAVLQKGSAVLSPAQWEKRRRILAWLALVPGVAALFAGLFFFFNRAPHDTVALAEKSVAVLPFDNLSSNKDDGYFADGVQDEILNNLAKIAQLKVISRTSVMQYRADTKRDLRQIASALRVANVLEGAVRRDGNHVRVSTELIDARNDHTIWADSYDRDLTDIFAIQSEIARKVASKLAAQLSPEEKKTIDAKPTDNLEAYDLYLRAREIIANDRLTNMVVGGDILKELGEALPLLDQAVQHDPRFALAYCAAADVNALMYHFGDRSSERRAMADGAINRVLKLSTNLPEVHLTYARYLYLVHRDYERARVQLAMAIRELPNNAETLELAAYMDRRQGQFDKAIEEFNESIARDPFNAVVIEELRQTLFAVRRFGAAEQVFDRLVNLLPDNPMLRVQKASNILTRTGDASALKSFLTELPASMDNDRTALCSRLRLALNSHDWQEAKRFIEKLDGGDDDGGFGSFGYSGLRFGQAPVPVGCYSILLAKLIGEQPDNNPAFLKTRAELKKKVDRSPAPTDLLGELALVDALLGNKDLAISEAKNAVEMLPISKDAVDGPPIALNQAAVYTWTNELDLAFQTLNRLAKTPNGLYYGDLKFNSWFEPLRKDPRYERLLEELAPKD